VRKLTAVDRRPTRNAVPRLAGKDPHGRGFRRSLTGPESGFDTSLRQPNRGLGRSLTRPESSSGSSLLWWAALLLFSAVMATGCTGSPALTPATGPSAGEEAGPGSAAPGQPVGPGQPAAGEGAATAMDITLSQGSDSPAAQEQEAVPVAEGKAPLPPGAGGGLATPSSPSP
jgi:hypothetical protein